MDDPILTEAHRELAEIDKHAADLQGRREQVLAFIHRYQEYTLRVRGEASGPDLVVHKPNGEQLVVYDVKLVRRPTIKEMVLTKTAELLGDGRPRHTRDLVDALAIMGVPLQAADKVVQVSKILSNDERFVADRARGWTLALATNGEGPDAGTSEPSVSNEAPNPEPQGRYRRRRLETS